MPANSIIRHELQIKVEKVYGLPRLKGPLLIKCIGVQRMPGSRDGFVSGLLFEGKMQNQMPPMVMLRYYIGPTTIKGYRRCL